MRVCKLYGSEICVDCPKHSIIIVDDITGDEIIFCFDKITDAKNAYAEIENSNEFAGFQLSPKTAIFMIPKEERMNIDIQNTTNPKRI